MKMLPSVIFCIILLVSCKTRVIHVPVESVRTEYKDRLLRDSLYLHDSVLVKMRGDTVFLEKYRYLYRDKIVRDSIFRSDTIRIPYPVEVIEEVNRLSPFQWFQVWCGRILLLILAGWLGMKWVRKYI